MKKKLLSEMFKSYQTWLVLVLSEMCLVSCRHETFINLMFWATMINVLNVYPDALISWSTCSYVKFEYTYTNISFLVKPLCWWFSIFKFWILCCICECQIKLPLKLRQECLLWSMRRRNCSMTYWHLKVIAICSSFTISFFYWHFFHPSMVLFV